MLYPKFWDATLGTLALWVLSPRHEKLSLLDLLIKYLKSILLGCMQSFNCKKFCLINKVFIVYSTFFIHFQCSSLAEGDLKRKLNALAKQALDR